MTIDEEKLSYIHLLLDEPIYVVKEGQGTALTVIPVEKPVVEVTTSAAPIPTPVQPVNRPVVQATPAVETLSSAPVRPAAKQPQPLVPPVPPVVKNKSKVLILFFNEKSPYLKKNEEALLQKILAAVHLRIDDVELLNFNNIRQIEYMDFLKDKVLNQLISFGVPLTELQLDIHLLKYKAEKVEGIPMLLADSLSVLEHDLDAKKQLWRCLKEMFGK